MKIKLIMLLMFIVLNIGCNLLIKEKAKPVMIDGLGSLSQLKSKTLKYSDLAKVVKTVAKLNRINDEDASAMLEIFKQNINDFSSATNTSTFDQIGQNEVEIYIGLILQHKDLVNEIEHITNTETLRILIDEIDFDKQSNANTIRAGGFVAAFLNAYFKEVTRDDTEAQDKKYEENQNASLRLVVSAYEQTAIDIVNNQRQATPEQKEKAERFLQDLKIYNEELKESEKILDGNGRLIDLSKAIGNQKSNIGIIINGIGNNRMKNRAVGEDAAKRMASQMSKSYLDFEQNIMINLKRQ